MISTPYNYVSGGGGSFSPSDLSGLQLWLKADALSLSNNDSVTTWTDSSGNGRDLTTAFAPTYKTSIVNSKPAVRFDGVHNELSITANLATTWGITNAFTVFIAMKNAGGTGTFRPIYQFNEGDTSNQLDLWYQYSDDTAYMGCGNLASGGRVSGSVTSNTNWMVVSGRRSGSSGDIWQDGVNVVTSSAYSDSLDSATASFKIGVNTAANWLAADIAEFILYSGALTTTERRNVESYLGTKYAISMT